MPQAETRGDENATAASPRPPATLTAALIRLLEASGGTWRPQDGTDARWSELTKRGNRALAAGRREEAWRLYEAALTEAERLLAEAAKGGSPMLGPMVHTISCQNCGEARRREGEHAAALAFAVRALDRLAECAEAQANPLALRINCVRHMAHALPTLKQSLRQSPEGAVAPALLAHARAAMARCAVAAQRIGQVVPFALPELAGGGDGRDAPG